MAELKNLIVNGSARINGDLFASLKGTIDGHTVAKDVPSNAVFTDTNTKVTAVGNHYTPSGGSAVAQTSGSAIGWSGTAITGITVDAAGHITGVTKGAIPANPNTDTKVTAVGNHYTPSGGSAVAQTSGSAIGWGGTAITGITVDAAGHITGVTKGAIPANPNTDTHDTNVAGTGIAVSGTRGNTIAINSTYQTYISNGNTAYGWGNHASAGYLKSHQDISGKLNTSLKGAANGLAELDANGKVPASQLPSYVDDVLEYTSSSSFPSTGETGKIYIAQDTNKTYRWSGSSYVVISETLALGETSSTAYAGDKGKALADKLSGIEVGANKYTHPSYTSKTSGLYKITVDSTGHISAATAVAKADITALGIPGSDTNTDRTSITVGTTNVTGTNTTGVTLVAGSNVTLTPDAANGKITVAATNTVYSHPTGDGNLHVPATGTSNNGKVLTAGSTAGSLSWTSLPTYTYGNTGGSGSAGSSSNTWKNPLLYASLNAGHVLSGGTTTIPAATASADGYMTKAYASKLDGIASGANNYSHPTGDGNLHVPTTGTSNSGKVLTAGSTAGSLSWTSLPTSLPANGGNADKVDGYHIAVVTSMPSSPDANTIYIIK